MNFYILDERHIWHEPAIEAATAHGYAGLRIFRGSQVTGEGVGFIRPHAEPRALVRNQVDFDQMRAHLTMIQDEPQMRVYESKSAQLERWGHWMPDTWRFTDQAKALDFLETADYPLVSKADEGASSANVRILTSKDEAIRHARAVFSLHGVAIEPPRYNQRQRGYLLLQRFIPHDVTWRVNALGNARAIFRRFCYPDRPVAQTGNVEPVKVLDPLTESLLEYSDRFFAEAGTKWCAIDVLRDGEKWQLLESSLAWPWPSPGDCNNGTIFRSKDRLWIHMFEVMFDEIEAGAWAAVS